MKIIFFGTPSYVVPILETLNKYHEVVAVVTQPPKEVGRKKIKTYTPVDDFAHKKHIPIYFDTNDLPFAEIGILAAYGEYIPKKVLDSFKLGIINIHPSLLPKFRGAAPVQGNIIVEPEKVGASIIKLTEKMDAGPVLTSFPDEYQETDTTESLRNRLFKRSSEVLLEMLPYLEKGKINPKIQDEQNASYTQQIQKDDGFIPGRYLQSALEGKKEDSLWEIKFIKDCKLQPNPKLLFRFIKAMCPWPQAWTYLNINGEKKRLKIIKAELGKDQKGQERLTLLEVQLEGKNPVPWKQFIEAYKNFTFDF